MIDSRGASNRINVCFFSPSRESGDGVSPPTCLYPISSGYKFLERKNLYPFPPPRRWLGHVSFTDNLVAIRIQGRVNGSMGRRGGGLCERKPQSKELDMARFPRHPSRSAFPLANQSILNPLTLGRGETQHTCYLSVAVLATCEMRRQSRLERSHYQEIISDKFH